MLGDILSERNDLTVADMEAGIEHLSRSDGTLRHVDILLIVLEPYRKALETARRTLSLASDLGIEKIYGVASKVEDAEDAEIVREFAAELGLEMLATVPYDESVRLADRKGVSVIDIDDQSKAVVAVGELLDAIEKIIDRTGTAATSV